MTVRKFTSVVCGIAMIYKYRKHILDFEAFTMYFKSMLWLMLIIL